MAGVKVYGTALRVIESINEGLDALLVVHKLAKLRRMFKTEQLVWQALEQYGKKKIVEEAIRANGGSLVGTSRR